MLCHSDIFTSLIEELLDRGESVTFGVNGTSMHPTIKNGDVIRVARVAPDDIALGDVLAFKRRSDLVVHRAAALVRDQDGMLSRVLTSGDGLWMADGYCEVDDILGVVVEVRSGDRSWQPRGSVRRIHGRIRSYLTMHPRVRLPFRVVKRGLVFPVRRVRSRRAAHQGGGRL